MPQKRYCGVCGAQINPAQQDQAEKSLDQATQICEDAYRDGYKKGVAVGAALVLHQHLPTVEVVTPPDNVALLQWALSELGDPRQVKVAAEEE